MRPKSVKGHILSKVRGPISGSGWNENRVSGRPPAGPSLQESREAVKDKKRDSEKGSTMTPGWSPARHYPKYQDQGRPALPRVSDSPPSHSHPPPVYRPAAQTLPAPARRRLNVLRSRSLEQFILNHLHSNTSQGCCLLLVNPTKNFCLLFLNIQKCL